MKEIKLTRGKVAQVDDKDYEKLSKYKWYTSRPNSSGKSYANRNIRIKETSKQKTVSMHREIMQPPKGMEVDHIDGNSLNNQRNNLRLATHTDNMRNAGIARNNTSGFKGVTWCKKDKKWRAQISVNRKTVFLGNFDTPEHGHKAYCEASVKYHKEFANYKNEIQ